MIAAGMCALAFAILGSYEIARSPVESLYIAAYGSDALPRVWIAVAPAAVLAVELYNRQAARRSLQTLLGGVALWSVAVFGAIMAARHLGVPHTDFALYVWKDVYIVVLLEVFWTGANAAYREQDARWWYGVFCAVGSIGAAAGGLLVGWVAEPLGTEWTLAMAAPLLLGVALCRGFLAGDRPPEPAEKADPSAGWDVLRDSGHLRRMLALIALVQVVITLVDYQYNAMLEATYPDTDARTAVSGQVYAAISVGSMALQLLCGPVLTLLGVRLVLLLIPGVIGLSVGAFAAAPRFATMAVTKVCGKVFDYSLFRAAKEILYIPLPWRQKAQGKAFIDMMTYRVAKALASVVLIALAQVAWLGSVPWLVLLLVAGWFGITVTVTRSYSRLVASQRGS